MIAPRLPVHFRDQLYWMTQVGEAWCIEVAGGQYFLTAGNDPTLTARQFLRDKMRNTVPDRPSLVASERYPLILDIDGVIVRAWPVLVPRRREDWSKTYENPRTGERVLATEDRPEWKFAARGRKSSTCGTTTPWQTLDDVTDLAKIWLRSGDD